jgi:hypothetical protein
LVRTDAREGQLISIQVSYHPGWHARAGRREVPVASDGLGLIWLDPGCPGPCEVELDYDGGWELRLGYYVSFAAIATLVVVPLAAMRKRGVHART